MRVVDAVSARWKLFKYLRNPRGFWEKRGAKDDFEKYPPDIQAEQVDFLTREFSPLGATSALEIGCGYGRILNVTRSCLNDPFIIVGIDFARPQLEKARAFLGGGCRLVQATATELPFADNTFELVYSIGVLMHIPPTKIKEALRETIRVSGRYVALAEGVYKHFHMFGLDFCKEYEALGLKTVKCVMNPYRVLRPKPIQFVVMEKQRSSGYKVI